MGSGDNNKGSHHHVNFHLHIPHLHGFHHHEKKDLKDIPKGCLAIMLLKVAEDEYGFDQKGPITIPCHVEEFRNVQGMIDKDRHHHNHHHHHHHVWCFRV
ncbi:hypothetical protein V6Z12_A12G280900 [Gossypium hirsutum]